MEALGAGGTSKQSCQVLGGAWKGELGVETEGAGAGQVGTPGRSPPVVCTGRGCPERLLGGISRTGCRQGKGKAEAPPAGCTCNSRSPPAPPGFRTRYPEPGTHSPGEETAASEPIWVRFGALGVRGTLVLNVRPGTEHLAVGSG